MRGIWRLGLLAVVAAVAFALALGRFSNAAEKGCAQRVAEDPSYQVSFVQLPRVEATAYSLSVTRAGRPVTGAQVCLNAYMQGMSAMATTGAGREVSPGTYEVSLTFLMGGRWAGRVLIAEPGKAVVAVPLALELPLPASPTTSG